MDRVDTHLETRLETHGVGIRVPDGWEAELSMLSIQDDPAALDESLAARRSSLVVLHVANFSLPPNRDDYGAEAVESMGPGGVFMALIEFEPASARSRLFAARGVPKLSPDGFSSDQLLRPLRNQSGQQHFFGEAGRPFCLYVVIGSHLMRRTLVAEANRVLSGLTIAGAASDRSPPAAGPGPPLFDSA